MERDLVPTGGLAPPLLAVQLATSQVPRHVKSGQYYLITTTFDGLRLENISMTAS